MRTRLSLALVLATCLLLPSVVSAGPGTDAIWVASTSRTADAASPVTMRYGDLFTAGYSSKTAQPWAFAECWAVESTQLGTPNQGTYKPGDVMWSGYRSLWPGGPSNGPFELTDPIQQLWLGGGATCRLSLVKYSGSRRTVLATSRFDVVP